MLHSRNRSHAFERSSSFFCSKRSLLPDDLLVGTLLSLTTWTSFGLRVNSNSSCFRKIAAMSSADTGLPDSWPWLSKNNTTSALLSSTLIESLPVSAPYPGTSTNSTSTSNSNCPELVIVLFFSPWKTGNGPWSSTRISSFTFESCEFPCWSNSWNFLLSKSLTSSKVFFSRFASGNQISGLTPFFCLCNKTLTLFPYLTYIGSGVWLPPSAEGRGPLSTCWSAGKPQFKRKLRKKLLPTPWFPNTASDKHILLSVTSVLWKLSILSRINFLTVSDLERFFLLSYSKYQAPSMTSEQRLMFSHSPASWGTSWNLYTLSFANFSMSKC